MAATFSITLDKNFRLDTGRKLEKISKSRDGFFSRGDNTAFFMELGIEAELNERFTTLLIIGSVHSLGYFQFKGKCYKQLNTYVEGVSNSLNILRIKLRVSWNKNKTLWLSAANQNCNFMCACLCSKRIKQTIQAA